MLKEKTSSYNTIVTFNPSSKDVTITIFKRDDWKLPKYMGCGTNSLVNSRIVPEDNPGKVTSGKISTLSNDGNTTSDEFYRKKRSKAYVVDN